MGSLELVLSEVFEREYVLERKGWAQEKGWQRIMGSALEERGMEGKQQKAGVLLWVQVQRQFEGQFLCMWQCLKREAVLESEGLTPVLVFVC